MKRCEAVQNELLSGSEKLTGEGAAHLASCPACQQFLARVERVSETLESSARTVNSLPVEDPWLATRIQNHLRVSRTRTRRYKLVPVLAGISVLLMVGMVLQVTRREAVVLRESERAVAVRQSGADVDEGQLNVADYRHSIETTGELPVMLRSGKNSAVYQLKDVVKEL